MIKNQDIDQYSDINQHRHQSRPFHLDKLSHPTLFGQQPHPFSFPQSLTPSRICISQTRKTHYKPPTMRFFAIATLFSLAVTLPAATPAEQDTSVARRGEDLGLDIAARDDLSQRQVGMNPIDVTLPWPATSVTGGGQDAQFEATNLGNSNYQFTLWTSAPLNAGNLSFRISYGGVTLAKKVLPPVGKDTVTVPKTGDNFNMWIELA